MTMPVTWPLALMVATPVAAMPVKVRATPAAEAVALADRVTVLPLIAVMKVLAGIPAPLASMPGNRLLTEATAVNRFEPVVVVPVVTEVGAEKVTSGAEV